MGVRRTHAATGAGVAGGALVALQLHANGELATAIGSPMLAGAYAFATGATLLLVITTFLGGHPSRMAVSRVTRAKSWWFIGGVTSAVFVITSAAAAPLVGLTMLTLSLVLGQLIGSMIVDLRGLSPHGQVRATRLRLLAGAVGLASLIVSNGGFTDVKEPLMTIGLVAVGAGVALGVAANGQLRGFYASTVDAALATMTVALLTSVGALVLGLGLGVDGFHGAWRMAPQGTPPVAWIGGILGAVWLTASAALVRRLGVLRLLLAGLTGQLMGALLLDRVAPLSAHHLDAYRIIGAILMATAVILASWKSANSSIWGLKP